MPVYDFKCQNCNTEFTEVLSVDERDKKIKCPKCRRRVLRKLARTNVVFVGGGFYSTDNRKRK